MEVPTKCNEFRRPALRFVQNFVKRHCTLSCRLKNRCENATSFSKKWGGSSQNMGAFSSSLCTFQSPSPSSPSAAAAERLVPHFSTFRPALSILPSPAAAFSSRGHAPTHTSRSRMRTSPSFDFLCSPFTSLLTNSYREGCGEGNGELCVKDLQVKPSHAIR